MDENEPRILMPSTLDLRNPHHFRIFQWHEAKRQREALVDAWMAERRTDMDEARQMLNSPIEWDDETPTIDSALLD